MTSVSPAMSRFVAAFLVVLFVLLDAREVIEEMGQGWANDAAIYVGATREWLAGGNPWAVTVAEVTFAAPPPSLVWGIPFVWMPESMIAPAMMLTCAVGALATVRLLRLPLWFLLFPPLVDAVLNASSDAVLVPLILVGAGPIAGLLKIYALVPLVGEGMWRTIAWSIGLLAATALVLPWGTYLDQVATVSDRLAVQTVYALPLETMILFSPVVLVALAVTGRRAAGWLAVPALWPTPQFHYAALAIPISHPAAVMFLALPVPGAPVLAVVSLAGVRVAEHVLARARSAAGRDAIDGMTAAPETTPSEETGAASESSLRRTGSVPSGDGPEAG